VRVCSLLHITAVIIALALFDCIAVVKMPNPQYYIELDNSTVASFDTESSTAEGLVAGSTEMKLKGHSILGLQLIFFDSPIMLPVLISHKCVVSEWAVILIFETWITAV